MTDLAGFRDYRNTIAELHPDVLREFDAALEAFEALLRGGAWRDDNAVVQAAKSDHVSLAVNGTEMLGALTPEHPEACAVARELLAARSWELRIRAVRCLHPRSPLDLLVDVLTSCATDRSVKVRRIVADWIVWLAAHGEVPERVLAILEARLPNEPRDEIRDLLCESLELARTGHVVSELAEEDEVELKLLIENGWTTRWYDKTEFEQRGLEAILKEIRDET